MNLILKNTLAASMACLLFCTALTGCEWSDGGQPAAIVGTVSDVVVPDESAVPDTSEPDTVQPGEILRSLENSDSEYGYQRQTAERYNLMTQNEETLYDLVAENAYTIADQRNDSGYYDMGKITIWGTELSEDEIKIAITAFKNDNPQVFWIANVYGRAYHDGNTIVQLYSYVSPSECNTMIRNMDSAIRKIVTAVGEGQSEFDRELAAFQAVAEHCEYDSETADSEEARKWESYTAYGALVSGTAVCEGYSRAMQLLLSNLGMECRLICGEAGGVNHMWNLVKLEEDWYHLDATWNDQQDVVLYDYFNLTDEAIGKDHQIAPQLNQMTTEEVTAYMEKGNTYNFALPECTAEQENYLQNCAIKIDSFSAAEDRRVIEAFQKAAQNYEPAAYLYIAKSIDFDMAVSRIFKGKSPKVLSYIDGSNKKYGIRQIDRDQVRYILNKDLRSITVILSYR